MDTLALTLILVHSLAAVAILLGTAVASCVAAVRSRRESALVAAGPAAPPARLATAAARRTEGEVELPRAA